MATPPIGGRPGGRLQEHHKLTVDAFKALCLIAGTDRARTVRKYFLKLEWVLFDVILSTHGALAPATPDETGLLKAERDAIRRMIAGGIESYATASRISVQIVVGELVRGGRFTRTAARDSARLTSVGAAIAKRFKGRENSGEIVALPDKTGYRLTWSSESDAPVCISRVTASIASLCRMRHSVAYGLEEVHARTIYDPWTYPRAFKADMEELACAAYGLPVAMITAPMRKSPWV